MKLLALETATPVCSVALSVNGESSALREEGRGIHSEAMFRMVQELLRKHDLSVKELDGVLVSRGPGQYTGLRIAASGVKGLLFEQTVPLWSLGTLEGMAAAWLTVGNGEVRSLIDARRTHLYHQRFWHEGGRWNRTEPSIETLSDLQAQIHETDRLIGTGLDRLVFPEEATPRMVGPAAISALGLLVAWQSEEFRTWFRPEDPERFDPEYLGSGEPKRP